MRYHESKNRDGDHHDRQNLQKAQRSSSSHVSSPDFMKEWKER
jgi:hypothetical protein